MSADDEKLWPRTFGVNGDMTYLELMKQQSDEDVAMNGRDQLEGQSITLPAPPVNSLAASANVPNPVHVMYQKAAREIASFYRTLLDESVPSELASELTIRLGSEVVERFGL